MVSTRTWKTPQLLELRVKERFFLNLLLANYYLKQVLYAPSLCRNSVFGIFLNKVGLKKVFGDAKVLISHNGVFLGKGYLNGSLFVLNLASKTLNRNASTSAYIAESVDLRHGRLGQVNFAWTKQLNTFAFNTYYEC